MAVFDPIRYDSGHGVDTVGIYVENHCNENGEFFIRIRFDNMKLGEKGYLPLGALPLAEGEGVRSTLLQGHAL